MFSRKKWESGAQKILFALAGESFSFSCSNCNNKGFLIKNYILLLQDKNNNLVGQNRIKPKCLFVWPSVHKLGNLPVPSFSWAFGCNFVYSSGHICLCLSICDLSPLGLQARYKIVAVYTRMKQCNQQTTEVLTILYDLMIFRKKWQRAKYRGRKFSIREKSQQRRSEERRVGKECRSRWSPYH